MKFGSVAQPEYVDFTLPEDHPDTAMCLSKQQAAGKTKVCVGCAKWNRQDLKNFYPKGIKDDLAYYASQFNSIELNATFYRIFPAAQYAKWYDKTPEGFTFFPKMNNEVSHLRRLDDRVYGVVDRYLEATSLLREKLGTIFLQLHATFSPKYWDRIVRFVRYWPKEFSLAIEFRHPDWFKDATVAQELYALLEEHRVANVLLDTAGRRDLMHMRLTNNEAFIRYVGANHSSDYSRLADWADRLYTWENSGLRNIHVFVHQNLEVESPLLSAYLIEQLNQRLGCALKVPKTLTNPQKNLFE